MYDPKFKGAANKPLVFFFSNTTVDLLLLFFNVYMLRHRF